MYSPTRTVPCASRHTRWSGSAHISVTSPQRTPPPRTLLIAPHHDDKQSLAFLASISSKKSPDAETVQFFNVHALLMLLLWRVQFSPVLMTVSGLKAGFNGHNIAPYLS
jgi:hypothetical protein